MSQMVSVVRLSGRWWLASVADGGLLEFDLAGQKVVFRACSVTLRGSPFTVLVTPLNQGVVREGDEVKLRRRHRLWNQ